MTTAELKSYILKLERENDRLRARNGELFLALREEAPHRLDLTSNATAGSVLPKAAR